MAQQPPNFGNTQITTTIQPGSAIVNPAQDDSGKYIAKAVDAGAQGVGTVGGDIFQRFAQGNSAKILNDYRQQVLKIADAKEQNVFPQAVADMRLRSLYAQFTAANPYQADAIDKLNSQLLSDTGLGHVIVAGTPLDQANNQLTKDAITNGYHDANGNADVATYSAVQHQAKATAAVIQDIAAKSAALGYTTEVDKAKVHASLSVLATQASPWTYTQIDNFRAAMAKTADPAARAQLINDLQSRTASQFAQWSQEGKGIEDTAWMVKPMQDAVNLAIDAANGKADTTVAQAQIDSIKTKAELALLAGDPEMAKLIAASNLLQQTNNTILEQEGTRIATRIFGQNSQPYDTTPGAANPSPAEVLNQSVDTQRGLKVLDGALKGAASSSDPAIQTEVNNQLTNLMRGIAKGSSNPADFNTVMNFFAGNNVAKWIANGKTIVPQAIATAANTAVQNYYQTAVIPAVINRWDERTAVMMTAGGGQGALAGGTTSSPTVERHTVNELVDPVWNGTSLSFAAKPQYARNASVLGLVKQLNTGDRSLAQPINTLIRATAHMTGNTDYTKIWESLSPKLFLPSDTSTDTKADIKSLEAPGEPGAIGKPAVQVSDGTMDGFYQKIKGSANYAAEHPEVFNPTGINVLTHPQEYAAAHITSIPNVAPNAPTIQVNKLAAPYFEGFLRDLKAEGYDFKSVEGYNPRSKMPSGNASEHAYGNAIDINPFALGNDFSTTLKTNLPANVSQLAAKWGLTWGGDWHTKKDAMHFEWTGQVPPTQTASN